MATQIVQFKRVSTFAATCTYTPYESGPPNLDGLTITSDVRDSANRIYNCSVEIISPTIFTITYSDTSNWNLGSAYWDIRFAKNGVIFFSDTVVLSIVNNVTTE